MSTRIYLVTDMETAKRRMIRAGNQAQAIRYAAQTRFNVRVANQDDLVSMLTHNLPVELAGGPATMFDEVKT